LNSGCVSLLRMCASKLRVMGNSAVSEQWDPGRERRGRRDVDGRPNTDVGRAVPVRLFETEGERDGTARREVLPGSATIDAAVRHAPL
jgi:hypothetical protein